MLLSSTCATLSMVVTIYICEVDPVKKFIGMQISSAILLKVPIFSFRECTSNYCCDKGEY